MKRQVPSTELLSSSVIEVHYQRPLFKKMVFVSSAEKAYDVLRQYINPKQLDLRECFWAIFLTNANRLLGISEVACGTTLGVKYILQLALLTNASAIIIAHNHPSGSLKISKSDVEQTKKLQQGIKHLEVTLLDHLIITSEFFVSLAQEGEL